MHRVTVFAHYDKNNEIQDYVIYYLKELTKVSDIIIFVSDANVSNLELGKINPYIEHAIVGHHGEYDFGSYKRGYIYAKEKGMLNSCDELIFANDSCYAPLFPFEEMFNKMSPKNIDFWGPTENYEGVEGIIPTKHVQSYFMVFKPQIFKNECFDKFVNQITKQNSKNKIIAKYEIGLTQFLLDNGFKYDVYLDITKNSCASFIFQYKTLISRYRNPFLKKSILLKIKNFFVSKYLKNLIKKHTNYDYNIIKKDLPKDINLLFKFIYHLIKCPVSRTSRCHLRGIKTNCMRLGVAYNLFDGEELLEASVKSIRSAVDYICVVYQKKSYYGEDANPNIDNILQDLKNKGLIDEVYLYNKDCSKNYDKHCYEIEKRNIGLKLCKKAGMTHFMSMDVDEFYDAAQLEQCKEYIAINNINCSACSLFDYLKYPIYRMLNGYLSELSDPYNFYVPFIMKIHKFKRQKHWNRFYTFVDATRVLNYGEKFYLFPMQYVVMHHMTTVRKNILKKYNNSTANSFTNMYNRMQDLKKNISNWEPENNHIYEEYYKFGNKIVKKVENQFNIDITEEQCKLQQ